MGTIALLGILIPAAGATAQVSRAIVPGGGVECSPPDAPECWRTNEEVFLRHSPNVATRRGDTLAIRLSDGRSVTFVDVPRGDGLRRFAFRGVMPGRELAFVDEHRYLGHRFHLLHLPSGNDQELRCWPTPSPSEEWLYCGFGVVDEGGAHGELTILRMAGHHAEEVWRIDLGPYRPLSATWSGNHRVEFRIAPLEGARRGIPADCVYGIERVEQDWRFTSCGP